MLPISTVLSTIKVVMSSGTVSLKEFFQKRVDHILNKSIPVRFHLCLKEEYSGFYNNIESLL